MADSVSEDFLRPYRAAVAQHGPGFEATLWGSREAQRLRFRVMIELGGLAGCTIVDVGCGQGDFAEEMLGSGVEFERYLGLDALPEVIEAARARGLDRCRFDVADVIASPKTLESAFGAPARRADFVCISGTLNTMDEDTARALVRASFDASEQGVIFNFLSNRPHRRWAERDLSPARRFDTVKWIDWALTLSSRVSFTQEYLDGHDATVLIRHDAAGE